VSDMSVLRLVLGGAALAVAAVVALAGIGIAPARSDLALRSGCSTLTAATEMQGGQAVMVISAAGCRDPYGRAYSSGESVDLVARTVWSSLRSPVDGFALTVTQTADRPVSATLSRHTLEHRFGPGPAGVVLPMVEHGPHDAIWVLLPLGFVVAGIVLAAVMRRSSVVVVWFRR
jgi:hypothetical protein